MYKEFSNSIIRLSREGLWLLTRSEAGHSETLCCDYGIGAEGTGFIMRDVQLKVYQGAGFHVAGITSRTPEHAREVANLRGIPRV